MIVDKETLTQKEVAKYCNTPPCSVSWWLNGVHEPSAEKARLLRELGFPDDIWGDAQKINAFLKNNGYLTIFYARAQHPKWRKK